MKTAFVKLSVSQQLARKIQGQIEKGTWAAGTSLPSMRELAGQYGVSLTTVQKAIHELDHQNLIERRPGQGGVVKAGHEITERKRDQIGVVLGLDPQSTHPKWWHHATIHAAQIALAQSGYRTTMFNYWHRKPDRAKQIIEAMAPSVDLLAGVISFVMPEIRESEELTAYLDQVDLPWMTINPIDFRSHHNFVTADNLAGGRTVGRCFVHLGYRRVVVLHTDEMRRISPLEKITGLYQGYLENSVSTKEIELICCQDQEEVSGYEAMREHLKHHAPPQGLFATGDSLAIGAMRACQEAGLRIPEDMGVVGSTGVPISQLRSDPPLAELCQPVNEIGRQVALCLLEMVRGGVRRISGRRVPCPFVPRSSLAVPPALQRELGLDSPPQSEVNDPIQSPIKEMS
jgi:DNA-binding LacI/PurR family transcriptional regulator